MAVFSAPKKDNILNTTKIVKYSLKYGTIFIHQKKEFLISEV